MLRFSYEWVADHAEEPHWADELYAIYDAKTRGLTEPIAWTWEREDAERIVDLLNENDLKSRAAWQLAVHRSKYDLSDLLA